MPRLSRVESLSRELDEIPFSKDVYRRVSVARSVASWLAEAGRATNYPPITLVNRAVSLTVIQQLAQKHRVQMVLVEQPSELADELPVFERSRKIRGSVEEYNLLFVPRNAGLLDWVSAERGVSVEKAVDHGVHILAALALGSMDSQLVVQELASDKRYIIDRLDLSAAPPLELG